MTRPILGIETTCDETSAAVLDAHGAILGLVIHSQDVHRVYGGVVPELAARDHLRRIEPVVEAALGEAGVRRGDLGAIAVAAAPGLIGALLVGVTWSRAAAFALAIPLVPVHHMEGHLFGPVLEDPDAVPPFVALLVSGGHTLLLWVPEWGRYHLLGETRDDAAGEAFDKVARILGLTYPGGPAIERAAAEGDAARYRFPRPLLGRKGGAGSGRGARAGLFDFSFSGLKTAVARTVADVESPARLEAERPHLAASFQEAVVDVLAGKTLAAARAMGCERVLVGGGVAANRALKARLLGAVGPGGRLFAASPRLSMDNGAMIARAGMYRLQRGDFGGLAEASARAPIPGVVRR
ncbi:MAG: tRNA (adenosine(37)-N6)-threonylcarbamoyltransferase complex transferase subunit TsaD [Gemmatimonadota bacterium]|nr:tRNA (adenosine(37)-N6)-threonylcarbamoyltransferase complex transferase subunit TsaD [Gemmatimonadota bacterium]MDE2984404.1 tRNA (adenosine(37)-N6)-threonylcarbamoyltransferase complex transferase subunit TsaD [Gemmatimonadota bacterium]